MRGATLISKRAAYASKRGGNSAIGTPPIGKREASGGKQGAAFAQRGSFVFEGGVRQERQGTESCKTDRLLANSLLLFRCTTVFSLAR